MKPLRGEHGSRQPAAQSRWLRSGWERVNNSKGEDGEAFLKVTWSVLGRGGEGWVGDGGGRSQEPVTLETESSLGQYGVRSATLGGDSL